MAVQAQLYAENLGFPLGGSQDACGFGELSFNLQQQKQQQQNHHTQLEHLQNMQQNRNQNFGFDKDVLRPENNASMVFDQSLAAFQMKNQRQDIDRLISFQSERLRLALQEQRKQQLTLLLKKYESESQILLMLRQKDEEIAKAANRTMELEGFLLTMESENQAWQRVAKEKEAIIITLNNTINKLRENACQSDHGIDDAGSCCDIITEKRAYQTREGNTEHELGQESGEHRTRRMICKSCNSRNSCVILLPCRHLCSCKVCEANIHSCPACKMGKKGSIEALI